MPSTMDLLLTSDRGLPPRLLPAALFAVAALAALLALVVQDDTTDTALGAVTGATLVLAVFASLVRVLGSRARRRVLAEQEQRSLDGLEPLRAARRDADGGQPG
jgi:membrane protein implicated in regulation of membrane protease activity